MYRNKGLISAWRLSDMSTYICKQICHQHIYVNRDMSLTYIMSTYVLNICTVMLQVDTTHVHTDL